MTEEMQGPLAAVLVYRGLAEEKKFHVHVLPQHMYDYWRGSGNFIDAVYGETFVIVILGCR
jgi:hypothetical protein